MKQVQAAERWDTARFSRIISLRFWLVCMYVCMYILASNRSGSWSSFLGSRENKQWAKGEVWRDMMCSSQCNAWANDEVMSPERFSFIRLFPYHLCLASQFKFPFPLSLGLFLFLPSSHLCCSLHCQRHLIRVCTVLSQWGHGEEEKGRGSLQRWLRVSTPCNGEASKQ